MTGSKVYVSSKLKHRQMWLDSGISTTSSWIHGEQLTDPSELGKMWDRYFDEIWESDGLVMYLEPSDIPKGCLIELGAAMMVGHPITIIWSGHIKELERVMGTIIYHESVTVVSRL